jgi:nucleoside-diphosphate-sugar epimerase
MNTLVTGAGGFIGSRLAKTLIAGGHSVKALLMPSEDEDALKSAGAAIFRGDITDPATLRGIGRGVDTVFHLAARTSDWGSKKTFERIMVGGTGHLLAATADDISRFIYFSSVAALGLFRNLEGLDENAERAILRYKNYCGGPGKKLLH